MKLTAMLVAVLIVGSAQAFRPQPATLAQLSPTAARVLAKHYPGWTVAPLDPTLQADWAKQSPAVIPNVIAGDFNGDDDTDYAVLVETPWGPRDDEFRSQVVAMVHTPSGFIVTGLLSKPVFRRSEGFHIRLVPKGTKKYDLDANRYFILERDAIGVSPANSGPCATWVYQSGGFTSVWTCD